MANIINPLVTSLKLDVAEVNRAMAQIESRFQSGFKNIASFILAPLKQSFALDAMLETFIKNAGSLNTLSQLLRADIQDVQAWGDAVVFAGGTAQGLQETLAGLEEKLNAATFGNIVELQELGINAHDANGNIKTSTDILQELAQAVDKVDPSTFESLTKKLNIDAGTIGLLQTGSKEVGQLVSRYKELAYTQNDVATANSFTLSLNDLSKSVDSVSAIFMRLLVPVLDIVVTKMSACLRFLQKHEGFLLSFTTMLAGVIAYRLTPALWAMAKAWLANPLTRVIALILLLALAFDDLSHFISGDNSLLEEFMKKLGASQKVIDFIRETMRGILPMLMQYGPAMATVSAALYGMTKAMNILKIAALSNPMLLLLFALATAAVYLMANWDNVVTFFENIGGHIKGGLADVADFIAEKWNNLVTVFENIGGHIKGGLANVADFITEKWNNLVTVFENIGARIKGGLADLQKFLLNLLPQWLKDLLGIDGGKGFEATFHEVKENISKTVTEALPSKKYIFAAVDTATQYVTDFGSNIANGSSEVAEYMFGSRQSLAPAITTSAVHNSSQATFHGGITIHTPATNVRTLANGLGNAIERRMTAAHNTSVNQGGAR